MRKILYTLLLGVLPLGISYGMNNQPTLGELNPELIDTQETVQTEKNAWVETKEETKEETVARTIAEWKKQAMNMTIVHKNVWPEVNKAKEAVAKAKEAVAKALEMAKNDVTPDDEQDINALYQFQKIL